MESDTTRRPPAAGKCDTASWLIATVLLGLPLISPLWRWLAVPCTHDGHLHYHRIAAMRHAWDNGVLLTRWLPDLAFGYGYPFFVYREGPPLYIPFVPHLLGLPLPAASNLFYALTILSAGIFMFLWVRDLFGDRAAVVSAVAYMAAPYILIDALIRGNSPESLALPLFPLILWAGRRWVLVGSAGPFLAGVVGLGMLSLSHNISTLLFAPAALVYLLALVWVWRGDLPAANPAIWRIRLSPTIGALLRTMLFIGLGLGIAFFYTGGALLEMDQVTLEMSTTTRNNDWRFNFASLGEILAAVPREDPSLVNPPLLFRLGWVPAGLAVLGLSGLWWINGQDSRAREQRGHIWLMALGALAYLFMSLPVSRFIWEALPLIDFVQFPWRLVGRAALPVAFLAGVPFAHPFFNTWARQRGSGRLPAIHWRAILGVAAATALLIIETTPNLYPRYCTEEPFPTILTVHNYERTTGLVGVDPEGSYFPRTVQERPSGSPLEADYLAGQPPQRFDMAALPQGATARDIVYTPFSVALMVESPSPFTARYLSFDFPGWKARIDGEQVPIAPEAPSGLITFEVPAGTHQLSVSWGPTPLRLVLVGLSVLSALAVAGVAIWARQHPPAEARTTPSESHRRDWLVIGLLGLLLLGLKGVVDRVENPLRMTGTPPVTNLVTLQGGELRLDGYTLNRDSVAAGDIFDIDMAWTAIAPPAVDYQSEVWLVGPDGLMWSEKGTERPRLYEDAPPTRLWLPGEWGWDSREVRVLSGTPPGTYDIVLTLFDKATLVPVTLFDPAAGGVVGPTATIGQITITNPTRPPDFKPQYPLTGATLSPELALLGYNQDRVEAAPGDSVLLTLFWECADPAACAQVDLSLLDAADSVARQWELPIPVDGFPAAGWPDHGRLRGQYLVRLPAGLESGRYQFTLATIPLGEIAVTAPQRQTTPPPLELGSGAVFQTADGLPVATLAGITHDERPLCTTLSPLTTCSLPLVWRAETETEVDYHVFVHLVDSTGTILAQSDGQPANWARPTTGWLAGEYITDIHTLALPDSLTSDPLRIRVGLYDPATGERLSAGETAYVEFAVNGEP